MTSNIIIIKLLLFIARVLIFRSEDGISHTIEYYKLLDKVEDHIKELEVD